MSGYDIAVKISLIENVTRGLTAMSGAFAKTGADAKKLEETMARIGKMTMMGGALLGAGAMGLKGLEATVEAASKYQKAVADFKTLNLSASEVAEVEAKAAENAHKVLGSTLTENVKTVQDLHTAFGDLHHALEFSTDFTKFEMVMKQSLGESKANGQVMAAAKALEHRGDRVLQNIPEFQDELNRISKVSVATKGVVTAKDFLQASNTGKMAYTLLDKEYLYGKGAAMMTMNGGDKFGTMLMTTFSSLIGGHMTTSAKDALTELGLYEEGFSKKRQKQIHDTIKQLPPELQKQATASLGGQSMMSGGLKAEYANMLIHDPSKFSAVLAEQMDKKYGYGASDAMGLQALKSHLADGSISQEEYNKQSAMFHVEKLTAEAQKAAEIFNRNTGMMLGEHILNAKKLEKDGKIFENAQGYNEAYDTYAKTQEGASLAMHGEWENLKTVLGMQLLPIVTEITQGITSLVTSMKDFAQENPEITKFIMVFAGALAIIALVAGAALLATAAFTALGAILGIVGAPILLIVGLFAALVAVGYMVYDAWQKADIKGYWKDVGQQIKTAWDNIKNTIGSKIDQIKSAIQKKWDSIKQTISQKIEQVKATVQQKWDSIKQAVSTKVEQIRTTIQQKWEAIKQAVSQKIEQVKTTIQQKWEMIKATVQQKMQAIWQTIVNAWNNITSTISAKVSASVSAVSGGFSSIYSAIVSWISKAVAAVQGALGSIGGAIGGMLSRAQGAVSSGINTIAKGVGLQTHVSFKVDGRTMAQGVVHHMNASAYRGAGGHSYDGSRGRVMA